MGNIFKKVKRS